LPVRRFGCRLPRLGLFGERQLEPGLLPGASVDRSTSWVDPLIGERYHYDLNNGFGLTAYGDVGGRRSTCISATAA
jgi:hypothetical protein